MELYCEDTQGTYDADLTAAQVAQLESEYADDMATQGVVNSSGGNYGFSGRTMSLICHSRQASTHGKHHSATG